MTFLDIRIILKCFNLLNAVLGAVAWQGHSLTIQHDEKTQKLQPIDKSIRNRVEGQD